MRSRTAWALWTRRLSMSTVWPAEQLNNGFACKFTETKDWAPIFLSPQLVDTEYGSLLNITDQLLKSWSNLGLTRYEGFVYAEPSSWPFAKPLPNELETQEVTYN